MDRVIYVQFSAGERLLWYAIEEQDGGISMRRLNVPQLDYKLIHFSVAVVNSQIYLIGGAKMKSRGYFQTKHKGKRSTVDLEGYLSLDLLASSPNWVPFHGCMDYTAWYQHSAAVSEHDGLIYTFGAEYGRFLPDAAATWEGSPYFGKIWEELPDFYKVLCREEGRRSSTFARLLALTHNKLIGYSTNHLICLDLVTREWELIDKDFEGKWSTGIVLEDNNSYLVSFGGKSLDTAAAVRVYDIGQRKWLPEPVDGLGSNDGTVLPLGREYKFGRLWRVGMVDGHPKMALVWSRECGASCEVHCSKFVLRAQPPHFRAQLLSQGVFTVHDAETTPMMVNGAAGMDIEKDKGAEVEVDDQFKRVTI